jgi:hypothetical protein
MTEPLKKDELKTCSRCPAPILIGVPVRRFKGGTLVEEELCDKCEVARRAAIELYYKYSPCGALPPECL